MYRLASSYFPAKRHPWPCFLFLLPLLVAYEAGVIWLGGTNPQAVRSGADTWLRWSLEAFGLHQLYWAPALLAAGLLVCALWRQYDWPDDTVGVVAGMGVESVAFALVLWGISLGLVPLLDGLGITLAAGPGKDDVLARLVAFVGAGIYEEVLFRLLLFTGLVWVLDLAEAPRPLAVLLAAVASAALFAAAHHVGPFGEKFEPYVFLFRTVAGVYFALVYRLRGFAIAVGGHACYDVVVGLVM